MHTITLIPGDGIGPSIADAAVHIIEAAGVHIEWERVEAGVGVGGRACAHDLAKRTGLKS